MGYAHHGSYAAWFEEARTEALRAGGTRYEEMERRGQFIVLAELNIRYHAPIRYDDLLEIRTTSRQMGAVRLEQVYEIRLLERAGLAVQTGGVVTRGVAVLVCVGEDGRPTALPSFLCPQ